MNTTIEALQKLYTKLGGEIEDVQNITVIPEMINAIENLPSISAIKIDSNDRTVIDNESGVLIQVGADGSVTISDAGVEVSSKNTVTVKSTNADIIIESKNDAVDIRTKNQAGQITGGIDIDSDGWVTLYTGTLNNPTARLYYDGDCWCIKDNVFNDITLTEAIQQVIDAQ